MGEGGQRHAPAALHPGKDPVPIYVTNEWNYTSVDQSHSDSNKKRKVQGKGVHVHSMKVY